MANKILNINESYSLANDFNFLFEYSNIDNISLVISTENINDKLLKMKKIPQYGIINYIDKKPVIYSDNLINDFKPENNYFNKLIFKFTEYGTRINIDLIKKSSDLDNNIINTNIINILNLKTPIDYSKFFKENNIFISLISKVNKITDKILIKNLTINF